eukprot:m.183236 g.183236  ORF g.183236 m.183236 type:complete len:279 (+) comp16649_c0_seq50:684-1520(+)
MRDVEGAAEQKALERSIGLNLLSARVVELRARLAANRHTLSTFMATFETELTETVSSMGALHAASEMYHGLRTEQALIAQVTSMNADHVLAALTEAYVEEESRKKEVRELKTHMKRILSTCQSWDEQHSVALQAIRTDALAEAIENVFKVSEANECNTSLTSAEKPKPYELAADFLRSSGKTDLLDACEDAHVRLLDLVQQRRSALVACARQLLKYLNVAKVYPSRIVEQSLYVLLPEDVFDQTDVRNATRAILSSYPCSSELASFVYGMYSLFCSVL